MKKHLFAIALLALPTFGLSQTYFSDNFDDEDVSDWTLYDVDGDGLNWADIFAVQDNAGNPVTPTSIISRSWQQTPKTPNNWIVSPAINLTTATAATLKWKVQCAAAEWDKEHYAVYVGTSSDIAALAQSSVKFEETYDDPLNLGTQYSRSLDVSSFAGQTIYIAFRHFNVTDMDFISIDDVTVEAPPSTPPTCATLSAPANQATNVSYNPTLTWAASNNSESYDIYLDKNANPTTLVGNVTGTSFKPATALELNTTYYWKVVPKNTVGSSSDCPVYSFTTTSTLEYCGPLTYSSGVEPITSVEFGGMTNTSSAAIGGSAHEFFLDKIATVNRESNPEIRIKGNTDGTAYTNKFAVFIDWNQDGDFLDAGESYFTTSATAISITASTGLDDKVAIGNIAVPADAKLGSTRMRIKKNFATGTTVYPNPCFSAGTLASGATSGYGQAEDYTIIVEEKLAVSDISKQSIKSYPNPVVDIYNIESQSKIKNIAIHDITGKQITIKEVNETKSQLDFSSFQSGLYIVTVKLEDGSTTTSKVVKK